MSAKRPLSRSLAAIMPLPPTPAPVPPPACARCGEQESAEYLVCRHVADGFIDDPDVIAWDICTDRVGELLAKHCGDRDCPARPVCRGCWDNLDDETPVGSWWPAETPEAANE